MAKKCVICGSKAELCVKDSSEYYCSSCAEDSFSDVKMLVKIEEDAARLKNFVDDRLTASEDEEDDGENEDSDDDEME